jgi:CO/xanthine dehydrogenase Mo-binding subunit
MAQVVAEELGVTPEEVRVTLWSSTDEGPIHGVGASRGARATTVAAYEASQDAKRQLRLLTAEFLGWSEEGITFRDGGLVNGSSGEQVSIEAIVGRSGTPVVGRGDISEQQSRFTSFGVQIAEVSVDPETGHVTLMRITTANETGQILNPVGFHGQIQGGIVYALGEALMEELIVEDGRVANPSFADMKIPTQRDIPEVRTVILTSESGEGPYNVRGIGEHTNIMTAPAIANAVQDAVGVRIQQLPVTAEKVYGALTSNGK